MIYIATNLSTIDIDPGPSPPDSLWVKVAHDVGGQSAPGGGTGARSDTPPGLRLYYRITPKFVAYVLQKLERLDAQFLDAIAAGRTNDASRANAVMAAIMGNLGPVLAWWKAATDADRQEVAQVSAEYGLRRDIRLPQPVLSKETVEKWCGDSVAVASVRSASRLTPCGQADS